MTPNGRHPAGRKTLIPVGLALLLAFAWQAARGQDDEYAGTDYELLVVNVAATWTANPALESTRAVAESSSTFTAEPGSSSSGPRLVTDGKAPERVCGEG